MKKSAIIATLQAKKARSAWDKGVLKYALELLQDTPEELPENPQALKELLLNGAANWAQYSWGGCSLVYDEDIAERLCSPSELKKCKGGERKPNKREEWLDTQARALSQAWLQIKFAAF